MEREVRIKTVILKLLFVQIDGKLSNMTEEKFGVPQGTIVGPIFFNVYVADFYQ